MAAAGTGPNGPLQTEGRCLFGGVPHLVTVSSGQDSGVLAVSVEDEVTAERWGGEFTARYLEDLSQKTGSFKPFAVFAHMLSRAVTRHNEAVSVDLLTYADLEALRDRKLAHGRQGRHARPPAPAAARDPATRSGKRYLIMTYRAEFDVVHYPLPLPATRQPGPDAMRALVHSLHQQLAGSSTGPPSSNGAHAQADENARLRATIEAMQRDHDRTIAQDTAVRRQQQQQQQQLGGGAQRQRHGPGGGPVEDEGAQAPSLRAIVSRLQEELAREKTRHQRQEQRQRSLYEELLAETEALRVSERQLRVRCRNLANELAVRKRRSPGGVGGGRARRSRSAERRPQSNTAQRESVERLYSGRGRAGGQGSVAARRGRSGTASPVSRVGPARGRSLPRSRSASPASRFDPTAYVLAREEKLQAARARRMQQQRRLGSGGRARSRSQSPVVRSRASSTGSRRSASQSPLGPPRRVAVAKERRGRLANGGPRRGYSRSSSVDSAGSGFSRDWQPDAAAHIAADAADAAAEGREYGVQADPPQPAPQGLAPAGSAHADYFRKSAEITDINSRLQALQHFLLTADP